MADETFDVGIDLRTGVNDKDYKAPFPFNGTIDRLTVNVGPPQLTAADQKRSAEAIAQASDQARNATPQAVGGPMGPSVRRPREFARHRDWLSAASVSRDANPNS